jgi:alkanesulfonate monooxygenase SsuD/methylene tetrahydromethanopterin reductase-like flavin-dependent oxidoreductase (luciferase family)
MRVGIVILPELPRPELVRRWQLAEAYGFDHAWTYDHLGWRDLVDGPWFDSITTLTAAASVTTSIRLGTFVASPNFRHPVHLAREITALDDISQGRLTLGVGAGGGEFDGAVLGTPGLSPKQRVDRFAEFVDVLDRLLTVGRITARGDYYDAIDARATPGCVQQPRVPFMMAANGPRSIRLAVRYGDGWVTTGPQTDSGALWWRAIAEATESFGQALSDAGRDAATMSRTLSIDSAPVYSLTSVEAFKDAVGRADALGFTDVITHWPRESSWYAGSESVLEAVADDVVAR